MPYQGQSSSYSQYHADHGDGDDNHQVLQHLTQREVLEERPVSQLLSPSPHSPLYPLDPSIGSYRLPGINQLMLDPPVPYSTPAAYPPIRVASPSNAAPAVPAYPGILSRRSLRVAPRDGRRLPAGGRRRSDEIINRHRAGRDGRSLVLERIRRLFQAWTNGESAVPPRAYSDSEMQTLANSPGALSYILRLEERYRRALVARQSRRNAAAHRQSQSLRAEQDPLPDFSSLSLDSLPDLASLSLGENDSQISRSQSEELI